MSGVRRHVYALDRLRVLAPLLAAGFACAANAAESIYIGSRLELFVDDYLIERLDGAALTLHHPTPRGVAIEHDMPWEGNVSDYHTMFRDGDIYRMYFAGAHIADLNAFTSSHKFTCYAESQDGVYWTRPKFSLVEFDGSKETNIIWAGIGRHNFAPFKDANPNCKPAERYKALAGGDGGLVAFTSPDGIHWSLVSKKPVITRGHFGSLNLAFWDAVRGEYREYHRGSRDGFRDIMTCTSSDFQNWTEPVFLEYPGAAKEHLYTNQVRPYYRAPHIFIGFPRRFIPERVGLNGRPGLTEGLLMTSRDGLTFNRWPEAFVRPGLQRIRWYFRHNLVCNALLVTASHIPGTPDELSLYSTEDNFLGKSDRIRRFTIRVDGFVSIKAPMRGGEMVTKPLVFAGEALVINFSTSAAGSVRVEIQDASSRPVPGFTLAESTEIFGDQIERVVQWQDGRDLSKLAGKPVRLRFVLKDADVFSIQFR